MAIYLLKDLSHLSGQSVYTLKFYLKLGLINELGRTPRTNFRYFDDNALHKLSKIRALRKKHVPLKQIKVIIDAESI